ALGYEVENPARNAGGDTSQSWSFYLRLAIPQMLTCDSVVCLPEWRMSRGANLEVHVARQVGMQILDSDLKPIDESVLAEADRLVNGDRNDDYGHPYHDFNRVVGMINA